MRIYFEDGRLDNPPFCDYAIDAAEGVRANIYKLDAIKEKDPDAIIYTNYYLPLTMHMLGIMNLTDLKSI